MGPFLKYSCIWKIGSSICFSQKWYTAEFRSSPYIEKKKEIQRYISRVHKIQNQVIPVSSKKKTKQKGDSSLISEDQNVHMHEIASVFLAASYAPGSNIDLFQLRRKELNSSCCKHAIR